MHIALMYHFNNALECLITVSKQENAMNVEGQSPKRFVASQMAAINNCSVLMMKKISFCVNDDHRFFCFVELTYMKLIFDDQTLVFNVVYYRV